MRWDWECARISSGIDTIVCSIFYWKLPLARFFSNRLHISKWNSILLFFYTWIGFHLDFIHFLIEIEVHQKSKPVAFHVIWSYDCTVQAAHESSSRVVERVLMNDIKIIVSISFQPDPIVISVWPSVWHNTSVSYDRIEKKPNEDKMNHFISTSFWSSKGIKKNENSKSKFLKFFHWSSFRIF